MSTFRTAGAFNGVLPAATGTVIGYLRSGDLPFTRYAQYVPAPVEGNGLYRYAKLNSDESARLVNPNNFAWGFDDPMPSGRDFGLQFKWESGQTIRYALPYQLGDRTQAGWQAGAGLSLENMYSQVRLAQAKLLRASQVADALSSASWGANTDTMANISGVAGGFIELSSGQQYDASGSPNPGFQIIKKTLNRIRKRIHLRTKGAVTGNNDQLVWVMGPDMATLLSEAGEIRSLMEKSQYAKDEWANFNIENWGIPGSYGGMKLVVDDTVRVFISLNADGSVADVTAPSETDYVFSGDTSYIVSRIGGLDGVAGTESFSTVQIFTYGGEAVVKSEREDFNEITKGAIVLEHKVEVPAVEAGFRLTDMAA